jgi:rhodanese-related sulfurtransferase
MKNFDELLKRMDLNYFGTGTHKITFEKMMDLLNNDKCILLDVRSGKECACISFPFANHIPIDEIPDRIRELPNDKTIVVFCSSATRATIVYTYLLLHEYDTKILVDSLREIADNFKPGYVLKKCENISR